MLETEEACADSIHIPSHAMLRVMLQSNAQPVRVADSVEHPPPTLGDRGIQKSRVRVRSLGV